MREDAQSSLSSFDNMQQAKKICLNSCYGSLASPYGRYYDKRLAEAITVSGQIVIRWIMRKINEYFNGLFKTVDKEYVVAGDTDSMMIDCSKIADILQTQYSGAELILKLDEFLNTVLAKYIEKSFTELFEYMGGFENALHMKRESIANKAVWTGKKCYIMNNVLGEKGFVFDQPKMKIKGIGVVKSTCPAYCKKKIKEAFKIVIDSNEEELQKFVAETKKQFFDMPAEVIASPSGISNIDKNTNSEGGYIKGTQMHIRAGILYNKLLNKLDLTKKYPLITNRDKLKFVLLKTPNTLHDDVIGFPAHIELPKEFDLHKYIDYEAQFEKSFLKPLNVVLEAIRWDHEKKLTLESFFE